MRPRLMFVLLLLILFIAIPSTLTAHQTPSRVTEDRPDDTDLYQIHLLYVLPSDGVDHEHDLNGDIARSAAAMLNWMADRGDGLRFRLDTYQGEPDITFVRVNRTAEDLARYEEFIRDELEAELIGMGFYHPRKIYLAYYDGIAYANACANAANPPILPGVLAADYLQGTYGDAAEFSCADTDVFAADASSPGILEIGMVHEIFHLLGAVASCGLTAGDAHTTDSPRDLMYAGDQPWEPDTLDIGNDDYWKHTLPDCLDIAQSAFIDPLPDNPQLPPGWSPTEGMFSQPTLSSSLTLNPVASGSCSGDSDDEAAFTFTNNMAIPVEVYWLDYDCQEISYGVIDPNSSLPMQSYVGHVWVVRDLDGNFLGEHITTQESVTVRIR